MSTAAEQVAEGAAREAQAPVADVVPPQHASPSPFAEPAGPMPESCRTVADRGVLDDIPDFASFAGTNGSPTTNGYLICATSRQPHAPGGVFP